MRINLPVTGIEYLLQDDASVVSKTDLKGIITYVNSDFVEASGYSETELIGQSHNLLRHPDMPVEAFDDLWKTLKVGKPWSGIVKNRRKNGDHYWVVAHFTPICDNGSVTGYLSVRVQAARQQIEAHDAIYSLFKEKRQGNLQFREGKAVKVGIFDKLSVFRNISLKSRLLSTTAINTLLFALIGALALTHIEATGIRSLIAALVLLGVGGSIWGSRWCIGTSLDAMRLAGKVLRELAQGRYNNEFEVQCGDNEAGELLYAVKSTQIRLGFEISEAYNTLANKARRAVAALDNVSTGVMITDTHRTIVYLNRAAEKMFKDAESDIRRDLPLFDVATLKGNPIDLFHRVDARHLQTTLEALNQARRLQIQVGGHDFEAVISPVVGAKGVRLGWVTEWRDLTLEVASEREVRLIVEGATLGNFSRRIDTSRKTGFFKQVDEGINRLMEITETSLGEVERVVGALAECNLTETIHNDYSGSFGKLKADINLTIAQLTAVIGRIQHTTDTIHSVAKQVAAGNLDLSLRTEQQADVLEQTAVSIGQLATKVQHNTESAQQANQLAAEASGIAVQSGHAVDELVRTMRLISDSSSKIVDIIGVIEGIAFQTNILALNAAVEAARAGEQGRGFAVVAGEVRTLAQRSATAAKEIKTLIDDSVGQVHIGAGLANKAGSTMREVVDSVKKVTEIMSEISSASSEQKNGLEQVNLAIVKIDEVTLQNASLVEQAASAAATMEEQARELAKLVNTFRLGATH